MYHKSSFPCKRLIVIYLSMYNNKKMQAQGNNTRQKIYSGTIKSIMKLSSFLDMLNTKT